MTSSYNKNSGKQENNGILLDCGPLKIYNELAFSYTAPAQDETTVYFSRAGSSEIIDKMRPVLGVITSYGKEGVSTMSEKAIFVCARVIFDMFKDGYFYEAVSKASNILGANLFQEEKEQLDQIIAEAWADFSGTHSMAAKEFDKLH